MTLRQAAGSLPAGSLPEHICDILGGIIPVNMLPAIATRHACSRGPTRDSWSADPPLFRFCNRPFITPRSAGPTCCVQRLCSCHRASSATVGAMQNTSPNMLPCAVSSRQSLKENANCNTAASAPPFDELTMQDARATVHATKRAAPPEGPQAHEGIRQPDIRLSAGRIAATGGSEARSGTARTTAKPAAAVRETMPATASTETHSQPSEPVHSQRAEETGTTHVQTAPFPARSAPGPGPQQTDVRLSPRNADLSRNPRIQAILRDAASKVAEALGECTSMKGHLRISKERLERCQAVRDLHSQ